MGQANVSGWDSHGLGLPEVSNFGRNILWVF